MRLLLDTNAFLWPMTEPEKLSVKARTACEDPDNELLLSVVSAWEVQIKLQLGKLELDDPLADVIERQRNKNNAKLLPIELAHIYALGDLEHHHRDPFDRLLIAQARVEGAEFVTHDKVIADYAVKTLWVSQRTPAHVFPSGPTGPGPVFRGDGGFFGALSGSCSPLRSLSEERRETEESSARSDVATSLD